MNIIPNAKAIAVYWVYERNFRHVDGFRVESAAIGLFVCVCFLVPSVFRIVKKMGLKSH